jgi:hypothetical protein
MVVIGELRWATQTDRDTIRRPILRTPGAAGKALSRKRSPTMHTVGLLAEATDLARQLEYTVREEYLEGAGGGHCSFGGKKWLLLDVTQSAEEQLNDVTDALRDETGVWRLAVSAPLAEMLQLTRAA